MPDRKKPGPRSGEHKFASASVLQRGGSEALLRMGAPRKRTPLEIGCRYLATPSPRPTPNLSPPPSATPPFPVEFISIFLYTHLSIILNQGNKEREGHGKRYRRAASRQPGKPRKRRGGGSAPPPRAAPAPPPAPGGARWARCRKMAEKAALRSPRFRASVGRVRGMRGVERVRRAPFGGLQPEYTTLSRGTWSARGAQDAGRRAQSARDARRCRAGNRRLLAA